MNLRDGFPGGLELDEAIQVAKIIEKEGADAIILSGGFVSKTPMYVMRGETPHRELIKNQTDPLIKLGMFLFSRFAIRDFPFSEAYFLEDALKVRKQVKLPLVFVGGLLSLEKIEEVLALGFDFVALARALIIEPDFINKLKKKKSTISRCAECKPCNRCIASMYDGETVCLFDQKDVNT
jgi:2,4-dienoyl-CoA reductase-like NADH-dependent reductase (Old Yellow Enzyme family)